ncbi:hypothetical protein niasHT_007887 [Heterodera trifolii]|uniref:Uncharacterized protein n=1 Tax=Heterodera trifolii TaxID=157864 RepID=A0ABD2M1D7_9BILA
MSEVYGFLDRFTKRITRRRGTIPAASGFGADSSMDGGGVSKACIGFCVCILILLIVFAALLLTAALSPKSFEGVAVLGGLASLFAD